MIAITKRTLLILLTQYCGSINVESAQFGTPSTCFLSTTTAAAALKKDISLPVNIPHRRHDTRNTITICPSVCSRVNHRPKLALFVSRSKDTATVPRRKNKNGSTNVSTKSTDGRRLRKSEIDDLVRGIGLEPVQSASKQKQSATPIKSKSKQKEDTQQQSKVDHHLDSIMQQLLSKPSISLQTQLNYSRKGHTVLRSFFPPTLIEALHSELIPYATSHALSAWRQKVEVQLADSSEEYHRDNARSIADSLKSIEECQDLLESLGMDPLSGDLPFLQHFNTWRRASSSSSVDDAILPNNLTPTVRKLCLSAYLGEVASILLDTASVRLYQDSLFHKRAGDGWTPWHSDARMAPFDTSKMITFWIPLQRVPSKEDGGTGLLFVDGSHCDFALPYWNPADGKEYDRLEHRYDDGTGNGNNGGVSHHMPLDIGDVTAHSGWTLHCADAADLMEEGEDRYAFAITYVDGKAEIREDVLSLSDTENESSNGANNIAGPKGDKEDIWSFRSWVQEVKPRSEFRHPSVPIVWPLEERDT